MKIIKGFSLIEIMVIITIISILSAIAIPAYQSYIKKAEVKACLSETKSYANDTYYLLYDQNIETNPTKPVFNSCSSITDASLWDETTSNTIIEAKSMNSMIVNIKCDLSKGANCIVLP